MVNLTELGLNANLRKMQENGQLANLIFIVEPINHFNYLIILSSSGKQQV
jgi:hypothetical protein